MAVVLAAPNATLALLLLVLELSVTIRLDFKICRYDFTAQSRSTAAICMVLQVGKMVLLTAARGMHELFQI